MRGVGGGENITASDLVFGEWMGCKRGEVGEVGEVRGEGVVLVVSQKIVQRENLGDTLKHQRRFGGVVYGAGVMRSAGLGMTGFPTIEPHVSGFGVRMVRVCMRMCMCAYVCVCARMLGFVPRVIGMHWFVLANAGVVLLLESTNQCTRMHVCGWVCTRETIYACKCMCFLACVRAWLCVQVIAVGKHKSTQGNAVYLHLAPRDGLHGCKLLPKVVPAIALSAMHVSHGELGKAQSLSTCGREHTPLAPHRLSSGEQKTTHLCSSE